MRNRSHRPPIADTHDDWVDGSWTVDCVCGVNYDDGEEMVNCDECGVWVHTRCSHYVKSEKSFACDKCKSNNTRNDSEETEVAQLLVDLPNKTLRMDNPCSSSLPSRNPFKLWAEIPIEEKVHVQGVPGGDPSLFAGLSSVFSPQLWKCAGYIPKKFNFRYRELPSSDEDEKQQVERVNNEENISLSHTEKTIAAALSLSKGNMSPTPLASSVGVKTLPEDDKCDKVECLEQMKRLDEDDLNDSLAQTGMKRDPTFLQPTMDSAKRKKEYIGSSRDRREKKKARMILHTGNSDKKVASASRTASTISSDGRPLEFYEDRRPKTVKANADCSKSGHSNYCTIADHLSNGPPIEENNAGNDKKNVAAEKHNLDTGIFDLSRHNQNGEGRLKKDNDGYQVPSKISPKVNEEVLSDALDSSNDQGGGLTRYIGSDLQKVEDVEVAEAEEKGSQNVQGSNGDFIIKTSNQITEVKIQAEENHSILDDQHLTLREGKLDSMKQHIQVSASNLSVNVIFKDAAIFSSEASDQKVEHVNQSIAEDGKKNNGDASADDCHPQKELKGSEGSLGRRKSSSGQKHGLKSPDDVSKLEGGITLSADPNQHKDVLSLSKSSARSSALVMSKSSTSGSRASTNVQFQSTSSKQRKISDGSLGSRKEDCLSSGVKNEERRSKKIEKEIRKSSLSCASKVSQSTMGSHASVDKRSSSDSKGPPLHSSAKASLAPSNSVTPVSGESTSSLKTPGISNVQNRISGSGLLNKSEKPNRPDAQSSSKVNTSQMPSPTSSNPPSMLSDEELALLLHQELNSSPRVPRVSRMRHAGSLPQLTSPTTASMLMKRTSSSGGPGGKDYNSTKRRKSKELAKDGSQVAQYICDEAKKVDCVSPSSDYRGQDTRCTTDSLTKRQGDGGSAIDSVKKKNPPDSTATTSSGLSSSAELIEFKLSSARDSARHASDEDSGAVGRPAPLTLPALIAKIMSKGERMTYEELCSAVLPHWPHLRKHNGERYAYSSHSQAVLDCLRNRSEWARLVDRGPKASSSRKRRKLDGDPSGIESEDNQDCRERARKEGGVKSGGESHQELFPKGKRQARKCRRLALQGTGVKHLRRRRRAEVVSDDESGSLSNSSDDSMFTEDEMEGGGNEASASSDETGT